MEEDHLDNKMIGKNNTQPFANGINESTCKGVQVNTCCGKTSEGVIKSQVKTTERQSTNDSLEDILDSLASSSLEESSSSLEDSSGSFPDERIKDINKKIMATGELMEHLNDNKPVSKDTQNVASDISEECDNSSKADAEESKAAQNRKISDVLPQSTASVEEMRRHKNSENPAFVNDTNTINDTADMAQNQPTAGELTRVSNGAGSETAVMSVDKVTANERPGSSGLQRLADIFRTKNLRMNAFLVCIVW
jgi:hypothetical protein